MTQHEEHLHQRARRTPPSGSAHSKEIDSMFKKNDYFILFAAFGSLVYSVVLWFGVLGPANKDTGAFVGMWVPSILALGCFAKLSTREKSNG